MSPSSAERLLTPGRVPSIRVHKPCAFLDATCSVLGPSAYLKSTPKSHELCGDSRLLPCPACQEPVPHSFVLLGPGCAAPSLASRVLCTLTLKESATERASEGEREGAPKKQEHKRTVLFGQKMLVLACVDPCFTVHAHDRQRQTRTDLRADIGKNINTHIRPYAYLRTCFCLYIYMCVYLCFYLFLSAYTHL